jgi:deoxyribodipyrimidine photo-lyase
MTHSLAERSCVVVTDDFPAFEIPRWIDAVASHSPVRVERIDSNGLLPMHATDRVFLRAHSFRRFVHSNVKVHLDSFPLEDPLADVELPDPVYPAALKRWPAATTKELGSAAELVATLPVDQSVVPVSCFTAGAASARMQMKAFIKDRLHRYAEERNQPESDACSGLSPYLHYGHISTHEIFSSVTRGRRNWPGGDADVEAFLDQLVTWRELGFNMCALRSDYDRYESLPSWCRETLAKHAHDPRPVVYSLEQFEKAETHDPLWNAAQRQLVLEGTIAGYLRMLWGKKILEWSQRPQDALATMIELNNKYALDGRDPNSYSGIFWILGRYDRPWGPERPIFGTVRYMSSDNTARKFKVRNYLERYAP